MSADQTGSAAPSTNTGMQPEQHRSIIGTRKVGMTVLDIDNYLFDTYAGIIVTNSGEPGGGQRGWPTTVPSAGSAAQWPMQPGLDRNLAGDRPSADHGPSRMVPVTRPPEAECLNTYGVNTSDTQGADPGSSEPLSKDRQAVERILGRPLRRDWPASAFPAGTRVRVIHDDAWAGPWEHEFYGTIDGMGAPEPVRSPIARAGELAYWVQFDTPQRTADGDGPYRKAYIWARYLARADEACGVPETRPPALTWVFRRLGRSR
jgi:hypothetical protein